MIFYQYHFQQMKSVSSSVISIGIFAIFPSKIIKTKTYYAKSISARNFVSKEEEIKKKNERKILFVNSIHRICALRLIRKRLENESFQFKIQQTHTQKKHAHTHLIITRRVWFSFS